MERYTEEAYMCQGRRVYRWFCSTCQSRDTKPIKAYREGEGGVTGSRKRNRSASATCGLRYPLCAVLREACRHSPDALRALREPRFQSAAQRFYSDGFTQIIVHAGGE